MIENAAPRLASLTNRRPRNTISCRMASASLAARRVRAKCSREDRHCHNGFLAPKLLYLHSGRWHYLLGAWSDEGLAVSVRHLGETPPQFSFFGPATRG